MKILLILAKNENQKLNFSRSALFHMKIRVSLKYFVNDCMSTYSPLKKVFEKQTKTIEDQGTKQIETIDDQGEIQIKALEKHGKQLMKKIL